MLRWGARSCGAALEVIIVISINIITTIIIIISIIIIIVVVGVGVLVVVIDGALVARGDCCLRALCAWGG